MRYDATRPEATGAALDRAPDHGEWYTKPVTVTFAGSDSTSGIASCTSVNYSGPDGDAERQRHLHRPRRPHERAARVRVQVRRHGAAS